MRQPSRPIANGSDGSPMRSFAQERANTNLSDAKERTAPIPIKVGHPTTGQLEVVGKKGWFWGMREEAGGADPTLLMFYAPTDSEGYPKQGIDLAAGDSIMIRPTNDTQPTYWVFDTEAGDGADVTHDTGGGGCDPTPPAPGNFMPIGSQGGAFWPGDVNPTDNPSNPYQGYTVSNVPNRPVNKVTPRRRDQPPGYPYAGDLWQSTEDETVFRRFGDPTTGKWYVQAGPTSGTFVLRKMANGVSAGQVVYETATEPDGADIASADNLDCYGVVLGVAIQSRLSGQYCVIQCSGDLPISHSFTKKQRLFLGLAGALSHTPPASGSGQFLQQIAIAGNTTGNEYIHIQLGTPVKRLS